MKFADQNKKYYFFLDETGDHGLTFVDEHFPIFLLAGCLFETHSYDKIIQTINLFKQEFFKTTDVVLHSRDIRKCEGAFQILFDLDVKKRFYHQLDAIMASADFSVIALAIDKKRHIEKYGTSESNPYTICLSRILEELIFFTDQSNTNSIVSIIIEKRGVKEDKQILAHYNSIIDSGTYHVDASVFKQRITDFKMMLKRDNNIGLQIADLCAYPIARHVLNPKEPYIPFQIIKEKLKNGLKILP